MVTIYRESVGSKKNTIRKIKESSEKYNAWFNVTFDLKDIGEVKRLEDVYKRPLYAIKLEIEPTYLDDSPSHLLDSSLGDDLYRTVNIDNMPIHLNNDTEVETFEEVQKLLAWQNRKKQNEFLYALKEQGILNEIGSIKRTPLIDIETQRIKYHGKAIPWYLLGGVLGTTLFPAFFSSIPVVYITTKIRYTVGISESSTTLDLDFSKVDDEIKTLFEEKYPKQIIPDFSIKDKLDIAKDGLFESIGGLINTHK